MPSLNRDPPNSTGYYVEPPYAHRLPITRLGHISAHIYSLRIINQMCCSTFDLPPRAEPGRAGRSQSVRPTDWPRPAATNGIGTTRQD